MTLYELNQAGYAAMPKMAKSKIIEKQDKVSEWLKDIVKTYDSETNIYFMLLNNDLHYYTLFNWLASGGGTDDTVAREIFSIVKDLGTLKSIELNDDGAWEFWITSPDATTNVYCLFDYTRGVIEV